MPARGVAASSCAMSRPRSVMTPRIRRMRDSMLSSTELSAAIWRPSTLSSEVCRRSRTLSKPWTLANWFGWTLATTGARDSSRASRSGGATKITVSLIGDGFGVPERRIAGRSAARRRPDRSGDRGVRNGAERGGARFQRGLAAHDLVELLVELFLIEQLAAGGAIDLGAQFGDPVFVGVLHLRLAGDQPGQNVVAEGEIGRGRRRPHAEHGHRADHDPERHRAEADLLAGMDQGIAVLLRALPGPPACGSTPGGEGASCRGHADGAGDTRNTDRNGTTSALPRRSEMSSVRLNWRG